MMRLLALIGEIGGLQLVPKMQFVLGIPLVRPFLSGK